MAMAAVHRILVLVPLLAVACQPQPSGPTLATEQRADDACAYALRPLGEAAAALRRGPDAAAPRSAEAYLASQQGAGRATKDVVAAIEADAQADTVSLDGATNALTVLTRCRQDQVNATAAGIQRGTTGVDAGRAALGGIATAMVADARLMEGIVSQAAARARLYLRARAAALGEPEPSDDGRPVRLGTYVAKSALNIRAQPTISATVVGRLAAGETVGVTGESVDGKWYAVEHRGGISYVARTLLAPAPGTQAVRRTVGPRNPVDTFAAAARDVGERLQRYRAMGDDLDARRAEARTTPNS